MLIVFATAPLVAVITSGVPLIVSPVVELVFQIVPAAFAIRVILPVPKLIVLVLVLELLKVRVANVNEFNASVPLVSTVPAAAVVVNALCNVQDPPTPSKVIGLLNVVPAFVIVLDVVDVKVIVPVVSQTVPAIKDKLPAIDNVGVVPF